MNLIMTSIDDDGDINVGGSIMESVDSYDSLGVTLRAFGKLRPIF